MSEDKGVKNAFSELLENLGMIGAFMLKETWVALRNSWGGSREEFWTALEKIKNTMVKSGSWAADDVERAYTEIRKSWDMLNDQNKIQRDSFLKELGTKLGQYTDLNRETFESAVNSAKDSLDKQWEQLGKLSSEQLKVINKQTSHWADMFKDNWSVFKDQLEKTGKKVDRAVNAAWDELKKKD